MTVFTGRPRQADVMNYVVVLSSVPAAPGLYSTTATISYGETPHTVVGERQRELSAASYYGLSKNI